MSTHHKCFMEKKKYPRIFLLNNSYLLWKRNFHSYPKYMKDIMVRKGFDESVYRCRSPCTLHRHEDTYLFDTAQILVNKQVKD